MWLRRRSGVSRTWGTQGVAPSLRFLIAARGAGSAELASLRAGDKLGVSGPLGNVWPLPADRGGPIALVGGGVGTAPLSFLATRLRNGNYDYYAGFRSKRYGLSGAEGARKLLVASEDGTDGLKGRIPDFFDPNGYEAVYACGPEPMLKAVAEKCAAAGVACHLSLERRMACGAGACLGCTVRTVNGNKRCCADGPVFDAKELCFDE